MALVMAARFSALTVIPGVLLRKADTRLRETPARLATSLAVTRLRKARHAPFTYIITRVIKSNKRFFPCIDQSYFGHHFCLSFPNPFSFVLLLSNLHCSDLLLSALLLSSVLCEKGPKTGIADFGTSTKFPACCQGHVIP
jgi:hypothetical protein